MIEMLVKNIINTEYAVAPEDGDKVHDELKKNIESGNIPILLDFSGITRTTTAFFNTSLAVFLKDYTAEKLNEYFKFRNIPSTSLIMLKNSIDLAKIKFTKGNDLDKAIREELKGE